MRRSNKITLALMASISATALVSCDDPPQAEDALGEFFSSRAECVSSLNKQLDASDGVTDRTRTEVIEACDRADQEARTQHVQNAPVFATLEQCAADFGPEACAPAPWDQVQGNPNAAGVAAQNNGSNVFLPAMLGYMLGSSTGGSRYTPTPVYYGPGSYREEDRNNRPIYSSGGGSGAAFASGSRSPLGYVYNGGGRSAVVSPSAIAAVRSTGAVAVPSVRGTSTAIGPRATSVSVRGGFGATAGRASVGASS